MTALYASQAVTAALFARAQGRGGQHIELSMTDSVVSFLWADAAGNEVLLDSDGSYPSSFVQAVQPFEFLDGWGVATPTTWSLVTRNRTLTFDHEAALAGVLAVIAAVVLALHVGDRKPSERRSPSVSIILS